MSDSDATLTGAIRRLIGRRHTGGAVNPEPTLDVEPESLRDCPACSAQVHVLAVRCRHCGQTLELRAG